MVFENRVLRDIFGHKRDVVTGEWRTLQNEELSVLYSAPAVIQVIKTKISLAVQVARMGERCIQGLGGMT